MSGSEASSVSCSIGGKTCQAGEYCDKIGCCERRYCAGGHTLPVDNPNTSDKLELSTCSSNQQCEQLHNDSYCSALEKGDKKFCCPVPYSKMFKNDGAFLLPTKVLGQYKEPPSKLKNALSDAGELSKKCEKNSECGDEEFCDEVVQRYAEYEKNVNKLEKYAPKICFPGAFHLCY
ncbi:hypothetical protein OSTOST_00947 [Ostertagia ostertagi]